MRVIPAIDLMGGNVVRLTKGDFARSEVFSSDPVMVAKSWARQGAELIHVVDLDGARTGRMENFEAVKAIAEQAGIPVEVGGGIRDGEAAGKVLGLGGETKVVLGTVAIEKPRLASELAKEFGSERIVVALDCAKGEVVVKGWTGSASVGVLDALQKFEGVWNAGFLLVTAVEKDGMMEGPDVGLIEKIVKASGMKVIASGGVSSIEDVTRVKQAGAWGCIVGKALYKGKIRLKEAVLAAR